jgi:hypothetical protein
METDMTSDQGRTVIERLRALRQGIADRGEIFTWDELKGYRDEGRHTLIGTQISNPPVPVRPSKRSS